jgi:hypothetical protein
MASKLEIKVPSYAFTVDKKLLRSVMRSAGAEVAAVARAMIRNSKTSAPGQPPANRTGNLASHMVVKVFSNDGEIGVQIKDTAESKRGSHAPYALFLEAGARGGIGSGKKEVKGQRNVYQRRNKKYVLVQAVGTRILEPRPFLSVAEKSRESSIAQRVQDAVLNGVKFQRIKP